MARLGAEPLGVVVDAIGLILAACGLVAGVSFFTSLAHLSEGARARTVMALGVVAGRKHFTPKGWMYRKAMYVLFGVVVAVIVAEFVGIIQ